MTFILVRRAAAPLLAFLLWPGIAGAQTGTFGIAPTLHDRYVTSVISDPLRNRLIVFGGQAFTRPC